MSTRSNRSTAVRPNSKPTPSNTGKPNSTTTTPPTSITQSQSPVCSICYDKYNIISSNSTNNNSTNSSSGSNNNNINNNNNENIIDRSPVQYIPCQHIICIQCFTVYNTICTTNNHSQSTCLLCNRNITHYNILQQLPNLCDTPPYDEWKQNMIDDNQQYYTVEYNVCTVRYELLNEQLHEYQNRYQMNIQQLDTTQYKQQQLSAKKNSIHQQIQQLQQQLNQVSAELDECNTSYTTYQSDHILYTQSIEQLQNTIKPIELQCHKSQLMLRGLQYM